jgi:hypothetical protein
MGLCWLQLSQNASQDAACHSFIHVTPVAEACGCILVVELHLGNMGDGGVPAADVTECCMG